MMASNIDTTQDHQNQALQDLAILHGLLHGFASPTLQTRDESSLPDNRNTAMSSDVLLHPAAIAPLKPSPASGSALPRTISIMDDQSPIIDVEHTDTTPATLASTVNFDNSESTSSKIEIPREPPTSIIDDRHRSPTKSTNETQNSRDTEDTTRSLSLPPPSPALLHNVPTGPRAMQQEPQSRRAHMDWEEERLEMRRMGRERAAKRQRLEDEDDFGTFPSHSLSMDARIQESIAT